MKLHFIYLRTHCTTNTKLVISLLMIVHSWAVAQNAAPLGWQKLGDKVKGKLGNENAGKTVATSADGLTVALGSPNYDYQGTDRGRVIVYTWDQTQNNWLIKGAPINGESRVDQAGSAVALSANGNRLIIGAPGNDNNGENSGQAKVYQWDELTQAWQQLGASIAGLRFGDLAGGAVDISADGNTIAVAAKLHNGAKGGNSGHTRLFTWNAAQASWQPLGKAIDGEKSGDGVSDYAIALAANGQRVAIGASANDGNGSNSGHTRVFEWNELLQTWQQLGGDVDGMAKGDFSGYAVDLSADGNIVAIGAPANDDNGRNSGHTRILRWNGSQWQPLGKPIAGEAARDNAGVAVALSASGLTVVIGAPENDGKHGADSGQARVYEWSNTSAGWIQLAGDIDGDRAGDFFGSSVAISADGSILTVGAPFSDDVGVNNGAFSSYRLINKPLSALVETFTVKQTNAQTLLFTWKVTSNENLKGFVIEASHNGQSFEAIGFVEANHQGKLNYSQTLSFEGAKYYRLRQIDNEGGMQVGTWQAIIPSRSNTLQFAPNPNQGAVVIRFDTDNLHTMQDVRLLVYNLQGVLLLNAQGSLSKLNQQLNQGLSQWKNGAYICQLTAGRQVFKQRLLLAR